MHDIIEKAIEFHNLDFGEITTLLKNSGSDKDLFEAANAVRQKFVGDEVHLRGLIEFSNICACNCKYCGLRRDNSDIERYNLSFDEIYSFALHASNQGYKTVVLQSGENSSYDIDLFCELISKIKKLNIAITLSIGEKSFEVYKALKEAGADRYLLRIETTDDVLYKKMHPNMSLENRKNCLLNIKKLGYEVGSGCLVGLPAQSIESLAGDILYFKALDADMIGIGPFIPNPNTPLVNEATGSFVLALKVMAITRLLLPNINIPATTAMETLNKNGRIIALQSGANVVMPNVTEGDYRKKYEIYPGKICVNDTPDKCRNCITAKIESIGRTVSSKFGQSLNYKF
ncbi:MAG: [FeFe] hydrogenase H-cluster radical SAM maturase HydE [Candidatus Gastranaerophilales bacterium]|nr:[FeFe] hydrogenase H-cluster radical SAM maturase HydE [Candidatus Gastranaerophilales bacterium]